MDRIQQSQGGTLNAYWERDGAAYDPGVVTVTITNDEGAAIVTGAATSGYPGTQGRTYVLTPAQSASLDYLTVQWTAADGSVLTTYAEIVGGFHFTVQQARLRTPLQDNTNYPTSQILFYRTLAEQAIEDICGVSFVPRFSRDVARITSWGLLEVDRRRVRDVRNIYMQSESGPQAIPTLAGVRIEKGGDIFMPALFNWWSSPIQVAYEHGYDSVPFRVSRASLELARRWIVESPWDERTTGFRTRDGGEMTILTAATTLAGVSHPFDIPEVVAVAEMYGTPLVA